MAHFYKRATILQERHIFSSAPYFYKCSTFLQEGQIFGSAPNFYKSATFLQEWQIFTRVAHFYKSGTDKLPYKTKRNRSRDSYKLNLTCFKPYYANSAPFCQLVAYGRWKTKTEVIMSGHDLGKVKEAPSSNNRSPWISAPWNKRSRSSPKFEISAPGTYSKIYGIHVICMLLHCMFP